jgi:hypothetical protein
VVTKNSGKKDIMENLFGTFVNAAVQELGAQAVQIVIGQVNALLFNTAQNDEPIKNIVKLYPCMMLKIHLSFPASAKIPMKTIYLESSSEFSPMLALQIRNSVVPWYSGLLLMTGWGPGRTDQEIVSRCHAYYIEGNKVERPDGPITL